MEQIDEFLIKFDQDVLFPAKVKMTRMKNKLNKWKKDNEGIINLLTVSLFACIIMYLFTR